MSTVSGSDVGEHLVIGAQMTGIFPKLLVRLKFPFSCEQVSTTPILRWYWQSIITATGISTAASLQDNFHSIRKNYYLPLEKDEDPQQWNRH
jgi:hypothetical protein